MQAQEKSDHESFNELKAAKNEEISINEKSVVEKEKRIGALALELSEGKHALEDAQEELANAQKFKANMKEQCANVKKHLVFSQMRVLSILSSVMRWSSIT